ncbi:Phosphatidyl-N-methylethanolamine N-methyltransferase [Dispira parvispora]|uniref:Phosphatidyl-N-methylethanolamine N-methyltransferase n=1 Tax=Dispira parvispora TaxID=1520584 RepID=A0A9W8AR59_9FUNG|nr:Phosphatidyl-N-methylethanolamine N-methyltransferase [Dispira parvispora]
MDQVLAVTQEHLAPLVHWREPTLWYVVASIVFNPTFWNIAARQEYHRKVFTRLAGGNSRYGCYILAATIFSLGILRDHLYNVALEHQPKVDMLAYGEVKLLALVLGVFGSTLVVTSMYQLGIVGTYLGDYFGILMDQRVTAFPFNVSNNPMYHGSTLSFLAVALWNESAAGLFLSAVVFVMYCIALRFEEPFTGMIYAKRDAAKKTE